MKILNIKKHSGGDTEVSLEAPEFENFGNRLEELQDLAEQANPTDPEGIRASTEKLMAQAQTGLEELRKRIKPVPEGPKTEMDSQILGMIEDMFKTAAEAMEESDQPDEEGEGGDADRSEEEKRNPHLLDVNLCGLKWNKSTESMLEQFFADWPKLRPAVLRDVFEYYKGIYPGLLEAYDYHKGRRFFIPEPTSPEAIHDIFYFQSIHLHKDGSVGLSGHCTWDEEHGFGVQLKNGKVIEVGAADIAY